MCVSRFEKRISGYVCKRDVAAVIFANNSRFTFWVFDDAAGSSHNLIGGSTSSA